VEAVWLTGATVAMYGTLIASGHAGQPGHVLRALAVTGGRDGRGAKVRW